MTDNKILKKVQKLLKLANCKNGNENEVKLAAEMAAKLMAEHGLSKFTVESTMEDILEADPIVKRDLYDCTKMDRWREILVCAVAATNNVEVLITPGVGLIMFGQESDCYACKYLFRLYMSECDRLTDIYRKHYELCHWEKPGRRRCNSYRLGFVSTLSERIRESVRKVRAVADDQALVKMDDLKKRIKAEMPRTSKRQVSASRIDGNAYSQGRKAGRSVDLRAGGGALNAPKERLTK